MSDENLPLDECEDDPLAALELPGFGAGSTPCPLNGSVCATSPVATGIGAPMASHPQRGPRP